MATVESLEQRCREAAKMYLASYNWQLLPVERVAAELGARVAASEMEAGTVDGEQLRKWVINIYCLHALHPACLGQQGAERQQRAFAELAAFLYPIAYRRWGPQVAEEATQDALVAIFEKVHLCRDSGAFLAFAIQKLRDMARKRLRQEQQERSLDELLEQDPASEVADPAHAVAGHSLAGEPVEAAIGRELRSQVVTQLHRLRAMHPRARRQLDAVWLRYIQELSMEETAAHLETTVENVSVLLNRGLERLRQEPQLLALARELLQQRAET